MPTASSCSPMNTLPAFSFSSSTASSSLCVRTTVSMRGLSVRAISIIRRTSSVSGVAITNIRARATEALAVCRQDPEGNAEVSQDERELTDLRQARRYRKRRVERVAEQKDEKESG